MLGMLHTLGYPGTKKYCLGDARVDTRLPAEYILGAPGYFLEGIYAGVPGFV